MGISRMSCGLMQRLQQRITDTRGYASILENLLASSRKRCIGSESSTCVGRIDACQHDVGGMKVSNVLTAIYNRGQHLGHGMVCPLGIIIAAGVAGARGDLADAHELVQGGWEVPQTSDDGHRGAVLESHRRFMYSETRMSTVSAPAQLLAVTGYRSRVTAETAETDTISDQRKACVSRICDCWKAKIAERRKIVGSVRYCHK